MIRNARDLSSIVEMGFVKGHLVEVVQLIPALPIEERKAFFDKLIEKSSYHHGLLERFQEAVLAFPKQWLIENIPSYAEPLLEGDDKYEEYVVLTNFFQRIDSQLSIWLAQKALTHTDPDIQEIGRNELVRLNL